MKNSNCSRCEKVNDECDKDQVRECLSKSECEHCDYPSFGYPYGRDESRHCRSCGAEWSVWK